MSLGDFVQIQVETNNKPQNKAQTTQSKDQRQQALTQEARKKFEEGISAATKEYEDGLKEVDEQHLTKACNSNPIEYAKNNGDGTISDTRSGLIWQKCLLGQTWDGSSCTGTPKDVNWFTAMIEAKSNKFLGKSDWRLPTSLELLSASKNRAACKQLSFRAEEIEETYLNKVRSLTSDFSRYANEAENTANNKQISELQKAFSENKKIREEQFVQSKSINEELVNDRVNKDGYYWSITPYESQEITNRENYIRSRIEEGIKNGVLVAGTESTEIGGASKIVSLNADEGFSHRTLSLGTRFVRAGTLLGGEGVAEFEKLHQHAIKIQAKLNSVEKNAASQIAKEKRDQEITVEKQKKEREAYIAAFRKNLKVGDTVVVVNGLLDTSRGLVLALNGNLVRIQVGYNEKWIRREELFPPSR